jgi:hypothetical protein
MRHVQVEFPHSTLALREHNSCTVYAVACVLGVDYDEAHALLKAHGRKNRRGTRSYIATRAMATRGTLREIPIRSANGFINRGTYSFDKRYRLPTVAQFVSELPKRGRFFLCAGHHAFAFVDGVILDNLRKPKTRARIYTAFEFIPPAPKPHPSLDPTRPRVYCDLTKAFNPEHPDQPVSVITQADVNAMWKRLDDLERKL